MCPLRVVLMRLLVVAVVIVAAGCGSKVNEENSKKIKAGMTLEEVEKILGKKGKEEKSVRPGYKLYTWEDADPPKNRIMVEMRDGKVDGMVTGSFQK